MAAVQTRFAPIGSRLRDRGIFLAGVTLAVVVHVADPSAGGYPVCPFYAITGLYCPGCGTLRCLHALLHADVRSAIGYNALTVLLLPLLLAAWVSVGIAALGGRPPPRLTSLPRWVGPAVVVGTVVFWALRNVPVAPFAWLAP